MTEEVGGSLVGREQYFFDDLNQLTGVLGPGDYDHSWTYDSIGNRTSHIQRHPPFTPWVWHFNYYQNSSGGNSQLLESVEPSWTYQWDDNGNLQNQTILFADTTTFTWNPRDQLTGITGSAVTATYQYNFSGFRTSNTVNGNATSYLYSRDWHILKETTGSTTSDYIFGAGVDEILNMRIAGADCFYYADALGSVRQINSSAGVLANSYGYDAWGTEGVDSTVTVSNNFVYTGRESGEAGLLAYRQRHYDTGVARFISEDPVGAKNYSYVGNRPTSFVDPTGRHLVLAGDIQRALGYLKQMVGPQGAGLLYTRIYRGRTLVEYDGRDRDALAASGLLGVLLADVIGSPRCVQLSVVGMSTRAQTKHGPRDDLWFYGGGVTIGADESLSGMTEILIGYDPADPDARKSEVTAGGAASIIGTSLLMREKSSNGQSLWFSTAGVLAHELGHAIANLQDEALYMSAATNDDAVFWENVWREVAKTSNRRLWH